MMGTCLLPPLAALETVLLGHVLVHPTLPLLDVLQQQPSLKRLGFKSLSSVDVAYALSFAEQVAERWAVSCGGIVCNGV